MGSNPGGHGVGQTLEVVSVLGQNSPGLLDVLGQLRQVGGSRVGGDDPLDSAPFVLYGVHVT